MVQASKSVNQSIIYEKHWERGFPLYCSIAKLDLSDAGWKLSLSKHIPEVRSSNVLLYICLREIQFSVDIIIACLHTLLTWVRSQAESKLCLE